MHELEALRAFAVFVSSALLSALLIVASRPLLTRYALARPNFRSSHKVPTPQGGGIAVLLTTILVSSTAVYFFFGSSVVDFDPVLIFAATMIIAGVGVLADIHPEHVAVRLLLQSVAVSAIVFGLPSDLHIFPVLPLSAERFLIVLGCLWFVNLVNFMDGIDWMTVAEVVPITAALALIGFLGALPPLAIVVSIALCGAMIGFAYFNRPVATLFLGDVGSLPIGLILSWLLILLAGNGAHAAAILLPLYYIADSTITLIRRALSGEQIWQAHRTHFYQRAIDRGFSVGEVIARVFILNLCLCSLSIATVLLPDRNSAVAAILVGVTLVVWTLVVLARGKKQNS